MKYKVLGVVPSWAGCSTTNANISGVTTTDNVAVVDFFTVDLGAAGTYSIDLIYDEYIIWTSPSVVVS